MDSEVVLVAVAWVVLAESLVGLVLNLVLGGVLLRIRGVWWQFMFQLTAVMTFLDLAAAGAAMWISMMSVGLQIELVCSNVSLVFFGAHSLAGILASLLSVERCLVVCWGSCLNPKASWLFFLLITVLQVTTLVLASTSNGYLLDPTHNYCLPRGHTLSSILACVPQVILPFSYISIYMECRNLNLRHQGILDHSIPSYPLVFMIIYSFSYFPNFILLVLEWVIPEQQIPVFLYALCPICLATVNILNALLVLVINGKVRDEVDSLLFASELSKSTGPGCF